MLLLAECFERLMWSEFFKCNGLDTYRKHMFTLAALKSAVSGKDRLKSKEHLELFIKSSPRMISDFETFLDTQAKVYTGGFFFVEDLVRADRG